MLLCKLLLLLDVKMLEMFAELNNAEELLPFKDPLDGLLLLVFSGYELIVLL